MVKSCLKCEIRAFICQQKTYHPQLLSLMKDPSLQVLWLPVLNTNLTCERNNTSEFSLLLTVPHTLITIKGNAAVEFLKMFQWCEHHKLNFLHLNCVWVKADVADNYGNIHNVNFWLQFWSQ